MRTYAISSMGMRPLIISNAVLAFILLIAGGAIAAPAAGIAPDAVTTVRHGNADVASTCSACHGPTGMGQAASGIPRLAGLNAAYLQLQLDDFTNGTRRNSVMEPIAKALNADQRRTLAAYYSKLPVQAPANSRAGASPPVNKLGEKLAIRGIWSRQVPGCVQCHGPHGVGVGANFPPLAGQPESYIANQLLAWKNGTRRNDPLGLMQHVVSALNKEDIQAVSEWFATQPAVPQGSKP